MTIVEESRRRDVALSNLRIRLPQLLPKKYTSYNYEIVLLYDRYLLCNANYTEFFVLLIVEYVTDALLINLSSS